MFSASVCVKKRDEADPGNVARGVRTWREKMVCVLVHVLGHGCLLWQLSLQGAPATSIAKGKPNASNQLPWL